MIFDVWCKTKVKRRGAMGMEGRGFRLEVKGDGDVIVLSLEGDGEHRLNPPFMDAISEALEGIPESPEFAKARAFVTTSHGRFFSNGLDLEWVEKDPTVRAPLATAALNRLLLATLRVKMPTIAAVCGHASAGGFLFALAHDYIFMRKDRGFLYMSEIDIGIIMPPGPMELIKSKMGPRAFKDTVLRGVKYTAPMAFEAGVIDRVLRNSDETLDEALAFASDLAGKNTKWDSNVYQYMRTGMHPQVFELLEIGTRVNATSIRTRL